MKNINNMNFIQTYTGKQFNFLDPSIDSIDLFDIAHALSNLCRYSGHVKEFYSVAEHCVILSEYVMLQTSDPAQALYALMHDASEAYLVDIPRPIKSHLKGYIELEKQITDQVMKKFNLVHSSVADYGDTNIIKDESVLLHGNLSWVNMYDHLGVNLYLWTPKEAENEFLKMFSKLRRTNG